MRDYDPTTGRFLQADPLGLVDGASIYGYAGQNPAMNADPTGECFGPFIAWAPACAAAAWAAISVYIGWLLDPDCYTWEEAGRDAAIGAAFGPLGAYGRAGATGAANYADDAVRAAAGVTTFKTSHYAPRLIANGLNVGRTEAIVAKEVTAMRSSMFPGAGFYGRLRVDGVLVEYRGKLLPNGSVNIGTLFPVKR